MFRKKHICLSLLAISLFGISTSCGNSSNNTDDPIDNVTNEFTFKFQYDENACSVEYDKTKEYVVGDIFRFKISLNDNYYLNEVTANGKSLFEGASGYYNFSIIKGENLISISTSSYEEYKQEKIEKNSKNTYSTLWSNWNYPHMNSIGAQKLLVIPVVVSDYTDEVNDHTLENLNKAFFGSSEDLAYESVASYYEKSSYGRFTLTGEVTPWFNPGYSAKEIATYIDESVISQGVNDYGTYRILDEAINWVKTTQKDINLSDYDTNKDGFVDSVYLVYSADTFLEDTSLIQYGTTFWNFTFYNIKNEGKGDVSSPLGMTYSWSSIKSMEAGIDSKEVDAHTYIHEFGHALGLSDYYDTQTNVTSGKPYTSPMGGLDMMDFNIGDQSAFSKYALGWLEPTRVYGDYGDIEIKIRPSNETGDAIILTTKDFNGTPFDEYFIIEYLNVENSDDNLNYYDSINGYPSTINIGSKDYFYENSGIRITHVDARAIDENLNFQDDIDKMKLTKFSNSGSTKKTGYYDPTNNNPYLLQSLISANQDRNVLGTYFTANDSDLFKEGDVCTFITGDKDNRNLMIPSQSNYFDDGTEFNFKIEIKEFSETGATIRIY